MKTPRNIRNLLSLLLIICTLAIVLHPPALSAQSVLNNLRTLSSPWTTVTAGAQSNVFGNVPGAPYTASVALTNRNPSQPLAFTLTYNCATSSLSGQLGQYIQLSTDGTNFTTGPSGGGLWLIVPSGSMATNGVYTTNVPAAFVPAGIRAFRSGATTNGANTSITGLGVQVSDAK